MDNDNLDDLTGDNNKLMCSKCGKPIDNISDDTKYILDSNGKPKRHKNCEV